MANFKSSLSPRLQHIFDRLVPGVDVWDLCCDHGYLGQKALHSGRFARIHFVDQAGHLIEALRHRLIAVSGVSFHGLPAQELSEALTGNVVAAGVGAELICKILGAQSTRGTLQARRLLLGPHKDAEKLQEWLCQDLVFSRDYRFLAKSGVEERGRLREIFIYEREEIL
jgi:tRNA (adenine22-N1)-methyltransferase